VGNGGRIVGMARLMDSSIFLHHLHPSLASIHHPSLSLSYHTPRSIPPQFVSLSASGSKNAFASKKKNFAAALLAVRRDSITDSSLGRSQLARNAQHLLIGLYFVAVQVEG